MSEDVPMKRCTNSECEQEYPATSEFFNRHPQKRDGLNPRCKVCTRKSNKVSRSRPGYQEKQRAYHQEYDKRPERLEKERIRGSTRRKDPIYTSKRHAHYIETRDITLAKQKKYHKQPEAQERERIYRKEAYHKRQEVRDRKHADSRTYRARQRGVLGIHSHEQVQSQLKRQKYKCYYCSCKFKKANSGYIYHIDHTFPLSRVAGTDIPANDISYLVLACPKCNISKGAKFPHEFFEGGKLL